MSAVTWVLSSFTSQPPACTMKALTRACSPVKPSPTLPAAVSLPATVDSWSQLVGTSASVSPAAVQASVLMISASVP